MKRSLLIIILLSLLLSLNAKEYIVAKAGKDVITNSDVIKQINQMKSAQMWNSSYTITQVIEDMIDNRVMIQKGKELNITADEIRIKSIIDKQIASIKSQFPNEEDFYSELRKANITLSELKKYYENILTEQQIKEQVINTQIKKKVKINDTDIRAFYEAHKDSLTINEKKYDIRMIIRNIKASDVTKKAAFDKISEIQKKLKKGEKFEDLAKKFSDCPSGQNGGDLGYFSKGMMVESFENAAFKLIPGEVSPITETPFGYHLIKLDEKKGEEIKARHILIKVEPSENDIRQEKDLLKSIIDRCQKGEDFKILAGEYTEDDSLKKVQGLLGEFVQSDFPELFADTLKALPDNGISDVIQNEQTLYLFQKSPVTLQNDTSYDTLVPKIREILTSQKQMEVYKQWIDQTKKEMYVKLYEDRINELSKEIVQ